MSLLTTGPESLVLRPQKLGTDGDGNEVWIPWTSGDPTVTVNAYVYPLLQSQPEVQENFLSYRVVSNALSGLQGRFTDVLWDTRLYQVVGEIFVHRRGQYTAHAAWTMRPKGD